MKKQELRNLLKKTRKSFRKYLVLLEENKDNLYDALKVEEITKPFINENGLKFPQLFQPIRLALTGGTQAPSVYDIIAILGFNEVSSRLNEALKEILKILDYLKIIRHNVYTFIKDRIDEHLRR